MCTSALLGVLLLAAPAAPAEPSPAIDFDLLGDAQSSEAAAPEVVEAGETRRTMLRVHQGLGIATWATLVGTEVAGQMVFGEVFGKPERDVISFWGRMHLIGVASSLILFGATGAVGLFAPAPYRRRPQWDTAMAHKILMGIATLGMGLQLALAEPDLLRYHQIVGYTTMGALTAGTVVLFF